MASYSSNGVSWYLSLPVQHKEYLGAIHHWQNVKIGFEEKTVWLKDLTAVQIDSIKLKTIPYKELYYASGSQLFLQGSLLPARTIPALLWTPVERGLAIQLPPFNHNYFGINNKIEIRLCHCSAEKEAFALLVNSSTLQSYVEGAAAIRLNLLSWVIVDDSTALVFGVPLLPLPGEVYWRSGNFLFPAGCNLELPLLAETLQNLINPEKDQWIIWNREGTYWCIDKKNIKPLSIGSFRLTQRI